MGITPKFDKGIVRNRFDKFIEAVERAQIKRLKYLGEMCVKNARENGTYTDRSGNLRSSIGYMVFKNGVAVHESYTQVKEGSEGIMAGQTLAKKVGAKYTEGIALVVTAGMSYAVYVEAGGDFKYKRDDGTEYTIYHIPHVVLTSAELLAKQELPKMIEDLKKNINRALTEE